MMNTGYTGIEIAEAIELPPALERAWHARGYYGSVSHDVKRLSILWRITDPARTYRMELSNGALIHHPDPKDTRADLTLTLTKPQLLGLLAGRGLDGIEHEGDVGVLTRLLGLLNEPDPDFAIVTP